MLKSAPLILLLFLTGFGSSVFGQQKTDVRDARAKAMLLGRHKLSLQWISWTRFGAATVAPKNGTLLLKGKQSGRGRSGDYLTIDGIITRVESQEFKFDGKIVMKISHLNGGEPCVREGEMTFKITGKRKYWRLQEMDNPCDTATDYVDLYFR